MRDALGSPHFFRALADPNRLALLRDLACRGACTVTQATACCSVDFSVVSRHLAQLRDAGLVQAERRGKEVYYTVCAEVLVAKLRKLADAIESCCCLPNRRISS